MARSQMGGPCGDCNPAIGNGSLDMQGLVGYKTNGEYELWVFASGFVVKKYHRRPISEKTVFAWLPPKGAKGFMRDNRTIKKVNENE